MTRAELLALADRVEREEPSILLDGEIAVVLQRPFLRPHPYTTSLDAAASLVPENWFLKDVWVTEMVCVRLVYGTKTYASGISDDEPRARTAAALRAMAMEMTDV